MQRSYICKLWRPQQLFMSKRVTKSLTMAIDRWKMITLGVAADRYWYKLCESCCLPLFAYVCLIEANMFLPRLQEQKG
eukprot:COSAG01_NODE_25_length_37050_cov_211.559119_28_plen_78_part_00